MINVRKISEFVLQFYDIQVGFLYFHVHFTFEPIIPTYFYRLGLIVRRAIWWGQSKLLETDYSSEPYRPANMPDSVRVGLWVLGI